MQNNSPCLSIPNFEIIPFKLFEKSAILKVFLQTNNDDQNDHYLVMKTARIFSSNEQDKIK